jgi:hypothetical protein
MTEVAPDVTFLIEQLNQRVLQLEQRIATLEAARQSSQAKATATSPSLQPLKLSAARKDARLTERPAGAVPVLGKAVLAVAGAYLLRAVAESSLMPRTLVLVVAILYAYGWLVWAARLSSQRFASAAYAITSALILSPLLWESTVRFQALSPAVSGLMLAVFVVLSFVVSWRRQLQLIPWIAMLMAVVTALALIVETREFVPLIAALLFIALAAELAACLGRDFQARMAAAVACDFALALLVLIVASPEGIGQGFHPAGTAALIALCAGLLAIYGGSIGIRALGRRQRITIFEIVQSVLAFVISAVGLLIATHGAAAPALGVFYLALALVCYWGTLSRFLDQLYSRNRRVFANWAGVLLIVGSFLLLPANFAIAFLSLGAIISAVWYARSGKISLGLHASLFLLAAAAVSPLPAYLLKALASVVPGAPPWTVWIVAASSALCYLIGSRRLEEKRSRRALWLVPALLFSFTAAALLDVAVVGLAYGPLGLSPSRLSVVRTIVNCALALGLGYLSLRFNRVELRWVAYIALAFGTLKLLFEDLRFGNPASLVLSLLFYGLVLILLPRMTRRRETDAEAEAAEETEGPASVEAGK